jgi:hypothetical protein
MLLAQFMPNSILHRGELVSLSAVHPIPENKNKEYIDNTQVFKHNIFTSIGSTAY